MTSLKAILEVSAIYIAQYGKSIPIKKKNKNKKEVCIPTSMNMITLFTLNTFHFTTKEDKKQNQKN